jgi:tape measure domain-containing protein
MVEQVGVEAVVNGLTQFLGNMGKINSSLDGVRSHGTLLQRAFGAISDALTGFGQHILRVAEYALGKILADVIQGIIQFFADLGKEVLESADTFQKLGLRLERLNFNALTESGMKYNEAMKEATRLTEEQIDWTIKLGATTPYDAQDIANIYTLARGYGFSAEEAKGLTESVIDFTSGMGLSNVELERIVINFGQLRQQGKLSGQDLRDLARGAFVPVNQVLVMTAEKMGLTIDEFNKLRKSGKLGAEAVDLFRQSFEELTDINFQGAAEALGNVFSVAAENVRALVRDMLAAYVVGPVLLTIGKYVQSLTDAIAKNDGRWKRLVKSLKRIGETATEIIEILLGLAPSTEEMAEQVVGAVERIANWFADNKGAMVDWVK